MINWPSALWTPSCWARVMAGRKYSSSATWSWIWFNSGSVSEVCFHTSGKPSRPSVESDPFTFSRAGR